MRTGKPALFMPYFVGAPALAVFLIRQFKLSSYFCGILFKTADEYAPKGCFMRKVLGSIASFFRVLGELALSLVKSAARFFRRLSRKAKKGNTRVIWALGAGALAVVLFIVILAAPGAGAVGAGVSAGVSETPTPGGEDDPSATPPSSTDGGFFPGILNPSPSPDLETEPTPSPSPTLPPTPTPEPELKLKYGMTDERISELQARLMELGYMDSDETTEYFGSMTKTAVLRFQRQHSLDQDGIVGQLTWDAIMAENAQHYALMNGTSGDDVKEVQQRLYELGYLSSSGQVTGFFGDITEEAIKKLQELNKIKVDGKVGAETFNLLYSDSVTPNYYSYGEESDAVKKYQQKLKNLGYLTTEPDGKYGRDTLAAIRQFQSRNGLVVDGYLGPSTRKAIDSSGARPNAISLGDSGDAVTRVQNLLYQYNYLKKGHVTGYFGEITEAAVKLFQKNNGLGVDGDVGKDDGRPDGQRRRQGGQPGIFRRVLRRVFRRVLRRVGVHLLRRAEAHRGREDQAGNQVRHRREGPGQVRLFRLRLLVPEPIRREAELSDLLRLAHHRQIHEDHQFQRYPRRGHHRRQGPRGHRRQQHPDHRRLLQQRQGRSKGLPVQLVEAQLHLRLAHL